MKVKNTEKLALTLFTVIAVFLFCFANVDAASGSDLKGYRRAAEKIEKRYNLKVIDSSKLTHKRLTHRKNTVIVERVIGKVVSKNRDGKILNPLTGAGTYISYNRVKCKKGNVVVTYLLWNPENNAEDDVIARWDFIIK